MRVSRLARLAVAAAFAISLAGISPAAAGTVKLVIDQQHSNVGFSVRHLFTQVRGEFGKFEGTIHYDEENIEGSKVTASIEAASIDTGVKSRDDDLRSDRFFDAATYPTLEFVSTSVRKTGEMTFQIPGKLTMHGVTRDVVLDAGFLGKGKDPWGNLKYGFHAETRVNRKDYGMEWNEVLETGGLLVGDEVTITLDIEAMPAS